jgi:hypothetical protein
MPVAFQECFGDVRIVGLLARDQVLWGIRVAGQIRMHQFIALICWFERLVLKIDRFQV